MTLGKLHSPSGLDKMSKLDDTGPDAHDPGWFLVLSPAFVNGALIKAPQSPGFSCHLLPASLSHRATWGHALYSLQAPGWLAAVP